MFCFTENAKKTFQIGEMCLKIFAEMEEDFERKVKPVNDEDLEDVYMI